MTSPLLWRHTELRLQQRHWHSVRYFIEIALHQDITLKNTVWGYTKRVSSTQSTKYYRFGLFSVCVKSHGESIVFFYVAPSPDADAAVKWYIFCIPAKSYFHQACQFLEGLIFSLFEASTPCLLYLHGDPLFFQRMSVYNCSLTYAWKGVFLDRQKFITLLDEMQPNVLHPTQCPTIRCSDLVFHYRRWGLILAWTPLESENDGSPNDCPGDTL